MTTFEHVDDDGTVVVARMFAAGTGVDAHGWTITVRDADHHATVRLSPTVAALLAQQIAASYQNRLLTPSQLSAVTGLPVKMITRMAETGQLRHVRTVGGHRRYPADVVAELLEMQARLAAARGAA